MPFVLENMIQSEISQKHTVAPAAEQQAAAAPVAFNLAAAPIPPAAEQQV